jgi:SAM-dependent MidA family methyltransferase
VLAELERLGILPARYCILETSADLRARQQTLIRSRIPHLAGYVSWLDRLPPQGFRGLVLANELLDAMPVHLLVRAGGELLEACVRWETDRFAWAAGPPSDARLAARMDAIFAECGRDAFIDGYRFEINLAMEAWLAEAAAMLDAGLLLLMDYGYPRRAYYHPQRVAGTLMCHYRHRAHDDPLILAGLQDVTAHVDFTALAEAAMARGLGLAGYNGQAWFLFGCGLQELVADEMESASDLVRARISQQIQRLTLPGEMGEKIKVMALSRRLDIPLCGFSLRDERGSL